jgi:hypothetical protein
MDRDNEMMMHAFMEKEANATADEDEHFAILACLIQMQANDLNNAAPSGEVRSLGEGRARKCRGWRVMTCYMTTILPTTQLVPGRTFGSSL